MDYFIVGTRKNGKWQLSAFDETGRIWRTFPSEDPLSYHAQRLKEGVHHKRHYADREIAP